MICCSASTSFYIKIEKRRSVCLSICLHFTLRLEKNSNNRIAKDDMKQWQVFITHQPLISTLNFLQFLISSNLIENVNFLGNVIKGISIILSILLNFKGKKSMLKLFYNLIVYSNWKFGLVHLYRNYKLTFFLLIWLFCFLVVQFFNFMFWSYHEEYLFRNKRNPNGCFFILLTIKDNLETTDHKFLKKKSIDKLNSNFPNCRKSYFCTFHFLKRLMYNIDFNSSDSDKPRKHSTLLDNGVNYRKILKVNKSILKHTWNAKIWFEHYHISFENGMSV